MHVLNLVTSLNSSFFQQQVRTLERLGVRCTNRSISVSRYLHGTRNSERRSVDEYVRFYLTAARESFGPYDLVHANYGLTAPPAVVQPNLPVVVSFWGSDLMGRYGFVSKACAKLADDVIVMSNDMAAELGGDCHVIPHGVDVDRFRPIPKATARDELGWAQEGHHVLFPYPTRQPVKNYPRARRVIDAARERVDDEISLQVASGVEHDRMVYYMNAADALLVTSRREGSPNTVKEAMACNLPVVSTDVGDVRDQLCGVSPSSVCRSDDELTEALVSVLERGTRSNGRGKVKCEMSEERMGERIIEVYEGVVDD